MCAQSLALLEKLLASARTVGPQILADDYLAQCAGMIGLAHIERMLTADEHAAYWATINAIKDARAAARKQREETPV